MAKKRSYSVLPLPRFSRNGRGIGFLLCDEDKHCDANEVFRRLGQKPRRAVLQAFEAWLDHHDRLVWKFHGWPNHPKYKGCFTFKWDERSTMQRFYGFQQHAKEYEDGFQLCVLVLHTPKNEGESDTAELDRVIERRQRPEVQRAINERVRQLKREGWPKE